MNLTHWDNRAITLSSGIYRWLLLCYPRAYRAEFGAAMAQLFRDQCRDAWRQSRLWGLVVLWLRVSLDFLKTLLLEHIANWKGRKTMAENIAALNRSRPAPLTRFTVVALAVFGLTFLLATVVTFILPEAYASRARIKVEPNSDKAGAYDPYFVQTQFEIIQSEIVLTKVVDALDLNTKWGKRYARGEKFRSSESIALLRSRLELTPVRNTSLIEIRAFSDSPPEAAEIANAVAETYRKFRLEQRHQAAAADFEVLKEQSAVQEQKIQVAQQEVDKLRRELNVSDLDARGNAPNPSMDSEMVRRLQSELITFESMLAREATQLRELEKIDPVQRRYAITTAINPDKELNSVQTDVYAAEQKLVSLSKGVSPDHPDYRAAQALADYARKNADLRVAGIMTGLSNRVAGLEAAMVKINENLDRARKVDTTRAQETRPYYEAKARLDDLRKFGSILNVKLSSERIDASLPMTSLVEIVDRALPAVRPARPNKPLNLVLGAGCGIILGVVIGGAALLVSRFRKKSGPPPVAMA